MEAKEKKSSKAEKEAARARKAEAKAEAPAPAAAAPKAEAKQEKKGLDQRYIVGAVIIVIVVLVAYTLAVAVPSLSGVSFPVFKQNLNAAARIAVTVTYYNETQYVDEVPCYTSLIEVLSGTREASTIDLFIVNQTSCTYSPTGLGHTINPVTKNASSCLATAASEPGIYLNFSSINSTTISPSHLYQQADASYLAACPLATEFA